jgi:hypothetical protein
MFLDIAPQMLPFFALGILGVVTFLGALGALWSACRAKELAQRRYELLRDEAERLELLREERKTLTEELERALRRDTEELLELEREGCLHDHLERQLLAQELEEERLVRSEDQREIGRLQGEVRALVEELERLRNQRRGSSTRASKRRLWDNLFGATNR